MFAADCPRVTSIVELEDGEVITEFEGQKSPPEFSTAGGLLVIYQKGMLGHPNVEERDNGPLFSPLRVVSASTACTSRVPWHNWVWPPVCGRRWMSVDATSCDRCTSRQCINCFRNVHPQHVKVVAMHDCEGRTVYQWYVNFRGDGGHRLTTVPPNVVRNLVNAMQGATHGKHNSLLDFVGQQLTGDHDRNSFTSIAARRFTLYRERVHAQARRERDRVCVPVVPVLADTHPGQCTICLEDTEVSRRSCVHKRCAIEVCAECRLKTHGMCALCDRSKLASGALFMCMVCDTPCTLDNFGFPCVRCGRPETCRSCYHQFGQCLGCECDTSDTAKRKREE